MKKQKLNFDLLTQEIELMTEMEGLSIKGGMTAAQMLNDIAENGISNYAEGNYDFGGGGDAMFSNISFDSGGGGSSGAGGDGGGYGFGTGSNPIQLNTVTITGTASQPSQWQSGLNLVLSTGEILVGVLGEPESGGLTTYLIIDGATRFGTNLANLIDPGTGASNLGGLIGKAVNGETGQQWGEMINDGITAGISGGALNSFIEAGEAVSIGKYTSAGYFILDGSNTLHTAGEIINQ